MFFREAFIDPGVKGGLVVFENREPLIGLCFKRNGPGVAIKPIFYVLKKYGVESCYVEKVPLVSKFSKKSLAAQWLICGQVDAVTSLACSRVELIPAQTWTSFTQRLTGPEGSSKEKSIRVAHSIYPDFYARYSDHDGIADALGIAMYIYRDNFLNRDLR
jgi:hypothetical protein